MGWSVMDLAIFTFRSKHRNADGDLASRVAPFRSDAEKEPALRLRLSASVKLSQGLLVSDRFLPEPPGEPHPPRGRYLNGSYLIIAKLNADRPEPAHYRSQRPLTRPIQPAKCGGQQRQL